MTEDSRFASLIAEARSVDVTGWDFSWFDGRAREQRPSWGYAGLLSAGMGAARAALELQTGGGEVLAGIAVPPPILLATESWAPNVALARRRLAPLGVTVVQADDDAPIPVLAGSVDLIASRHPTSQDYDEVQRVLRPGGRYLSQQVGAGSNRELYEYLMGPQPHPAGTQVARTRSALSAAGLDAQRIEHEALRVEFDDIAAVVVFLRKVLWTVPAFTIERYHDRLFDLHRQIMAAGPFIAHSQRVLVDARRPA